MEMLVLGVVMALLVGGLAVIWAMIAEHAPQITAALRGDGVASAPAAPTTSARVLRFELRKDGQRSQPMPNFTQDADVGTFVVPKRVVLPLAA